MKFQLVDLDQDRLRPFRHEEPSYEYKRMIKWRTEMKGLVAIFTLVGALSFWGGAEVARAAQELSCSTTSCSFNKEIGPAGSATYHGHCDGTGNTKVTDKNSSMKCNHGDHSTCTDSFWGKYKGDFYWTCTCTNDSVTKETHPTIDMTCPAPS